jgi:hypothetical protein
MQPPGLQQFSQLHNSPTSPPDQRSNDLSPVFEKSIRSVISYRLVFLIRCFIFLAFDLFSLSHAFAFSICFTLAFTYSYDLFSLPFARRIYFRFHMIVRFTFSLSHVRMIFMVFLFSHARLIFILTCLYGFLFSHALLAFNSRVLLNT